MNDDFAVPQTAAFVCPHVFRDERPILLVVHAGGDWQFLCGGADHHGDGHVVGIGHLLRRDPSLTALQDLPAGWESERADLESAWRRMACPPDALA